MGAHGEDGQVNENQWQEKRKFQRINVSFTIMYKVNSPLTVRMVAGEKKEAAIALDISEGGMGVLISYDIAVSTIVTVKFAMVNLDTSRIEDQYRSMELEGEVRYSFYAKEKNAYRLGINFINISNDERNFIANFIKTFSAKRENHE